MGDSVAPIDESELAELEAEVESQTRSLGPPIHAFKGSPTHTTTAPATPTHASAAPSAPAPPTIINQGSTTLTPAQVATLVLIFLVAALGLGLALMGNFSETEGDMIKDGTVAHIDLAPEAVQTANLVDGSVSTAKLGAGSVTSAKIASDAVETSQLAEASVTAEKLADDAVVSTKIADAAVLAAHLGSDAVQTAHLADDSVSSAKLQADAVTNSHLADGAVTTDEIADGAVTTAKLDWSAPDSATFTDVTATSVAASAGVTVSAGGLSVVAGGLDINNSGLSNAGSIGASAVTGTSFTDGTATLTNGALSGATTGAFSGDVSVGGDVTVASLSSSSSITADTDASVGGDLSVSGDASIGGDLTDVVAVSASGAVATTGSLSAGTTLSVTGDVTAGADVAVAGALAVTGATTVAGLTASGTVAGNAVTVTTTTTTADLAVTGSATANDLAVTTTITADDVTASGTVTGNDLSVTTTTATADLTVSGTGTVATLVATGSTTTTTLATTDATTLGDAAGDAVSVLGTATFAEPVTASSDLSVGGDADVVGELSVTAASSLGGAVAAGSTLDVTGATTVTSLAASTTLSVSGASTLAGLSATTVAASDAVSLASTLDVTGVSTLGDVDCASADVTGAVTADSLDVATDVTLGSDGGVDTIVIGTSGDDVTVGGLATFEEAVGMDDTLDVSGAATFVAAVGMQATLDVDGAVNFDGAVVQTDATDSSDKDTGAIVTEGGLGVELNVNVGAELGVGGSAVFASDVTLQTYLDFDSVDVSAGASISIPATHSFVRITDEGGSQANAITIASGVEGQMMWITNGDADDTSGVFDIPAGKTVPVTFVNGGWADVTAIGMTQNPLESNTAAASTGAKYTFQRSRGSAGAEVLVTDGDVLAELLFQAYDGDSYEDSAQVRAEVDESSVADSSVGGRLVLATSDEGGASVVDRVTVDSAGDVSVHTGAMDVTADRAAGVTSMLSLTSTSTAGVGAAGDGTAIDLFAETNAGATEQVAALQAVLTDATGGAADAELRLATALAGTVTTQVTIDSDGNVAVPNGEVQCADITSAATMGVVAATGLSLEATDGDVVVNAQDDTVQLQQAGTTVVTVAGAAVTVAQELKVLPSASASVTSTGDLGVVATMGVVVQSTDGDVVLNADDGDNGGGDDVLLQVDGVTRLSATATGVALAGGDATAVVTTTTSDVTVAQELKVLPSTTKSVTSTGDMGVVATTGVVVQSTDGDVVLNADDGDNGGGDDVLLQVDGVTRLSATATGVALAGGDATAVVTTTTSDVTVAQELKVLPSTTKSVTSTGALGVVAAGSDGNTGIHVAATEGDVVINVDDQNNSGESLQLQVDGVTRLSGSATGVVLAGGDATAVVTTTTSDVTVAQELKVLPSTTKSITSTGDLGVVAAGSSGATGIKMEATDGDIVINVVDTLGANDDLLLQHGGATVVTVGSAAVTAAQELQVMPSTAASVTSTGDIGITAAGSDGSTGIKIEATEGDVVINVVDTASSNDDLLLQHGGATILTVASDAVTSTQTIAVMPSTASSLTSTGDIGITAAGSDGTTGIKIEATEGDVVINVVDTASTNDDLLLQHGGATVVTVGSAAVTVAQELQLLDSSTSSLTSSGDLGIKAAGTTATNSLVLEATEGHVVIDAADDGGGSDDDVLLQVGGVTRVTAADTGVVLAGGDATAVVTTTTSDVTVAQELKVLPSSTKSVTSTGKLAVVATGANGADSLLLTATNGHVTINAKDSNSGNDDDVLLQVDDVTRVTASDTGVVLAGGDATAVLTTTTSDVTVAQELKVLPSTTASITSTGDLGFVAAGSDGSTGIRVEATEGDVVINVVDTANANDDLLLQHGGATVLTVGSAAVTAAQELKVLPSTTKSVTSTGDLGFVAAGSDGSTGVKVEATEGDIVINVVDTANANDDLLLQHGGATVLTVGSAAVTAAQTLAVKASTTSSITSTGDIGITAAGSNGATGIKVEATEGDVVINVADSAGANDDLLLQHGGATVVTVGSSQITAAQTLQVKASTTSSVTAGGAMGVVAAGSDGNTGLKLEATDGNVVINVVDSASANDDLLLQHSGATVLTVGSAAVTAAQTLAVKASTTSSITSTGDLGLVAAGSDGATGVKIEATEGDVVINVVDTANANDDLLLQHGGATVLTVGSAAVTAAQTLAVKASTTSSITSTGDIGITAAGSDGATGVKIEATEGDVVINVVDTANANDDLLLQHGGATVLTVGSAAVTAAQPIAVQPSATASVTSTGAMGIKADGSDGSTGLLLQATEGDLVIDAADSANGNDELLLQYGGATKLAIADSAMTASVAMVMPHGTGTVSTSAVTVNAMTGVVTSESAALGAGASETWTLTNSAIAGTSVVVATVSDRCNSGFVMVAEAVPSAGSASVTVVNLGGSACTSTYEVAFAVF